MRGKHKKYTYFLYLFNIILNSYEYVIRLIAHHSLMIDSGLIPFQKTFNRY